MRRLLLVCFALSAIAQVSFGQVPTDSLIACYPFNGNANDTSGRGNNGTVYGATLTIDRFGNPNRAFDFNGTNNYIEIPDNSVLRPALLSIAAWINPRVSNVGDFIYKCTYGTATNEQYALALTASSLVNGGIKRNSNCQPAAGWVQSSTSQTIPINQWTFVCMTWDGTLLRLYVNGVLVAINTSGPAGAIDGCSGGSLRLGIGWNTSSPFNGKLDDIRLYSRAVTETEVRALYHEGGWDIQNQGLIAYYPFNGNANDSSGNGNNGSVTGATLTADRFGRAGSAYDFNGGGTTLIQIPDNSVLRPAVLSVAGWMYPRVYFGSAFYKQTIAGNANEQYASSLRTTGILHGGVKRNSSCVPGSGWLELDSPQTIPTNQWTFFCFTWDGVVLKEYVNGTLVSSNVNGPIGAIDPCAGGPLSLGLSYNGKLDDIRFYNRAVSAGEVDSLFHENGWAQLPSALTLIYPTQAAVFSSSFVPFYWGKGGGLNTKFWFELATDSLFTFKSMDSTLTDTSKTTTLPGAGKYWWRVKAKNGMGWGLFSPARAFSYIATGVAKGESIPKDYALEQNYPNPFNPSTVIRYGLPSKSHVSLSVYSTLGQQVAVLQNGEQAAGYHEVRFDGSGMASGVYFYRIQAAAYVETRKLLLIR